MGSSPLRTSGIIIVGVLAFTAVIVYAQIRATIDCRAQGYPFAEIDWTGETYCMSGTPLRELE